MDETEEVEVEVSEADSFIKSAMLESSKYVLRGELLGANISDAINWIIYENLDTSVPKLLTLIINSVGGEVYEAFGLIDVMQASVHPIKVIGIGTVMSSAFLIFLSGTRGHRVIGKNTGIMCHQFSMANEAKFHDIKATNRENEWVHQRMINIIQLGTGMTAAAIKKKLLRPSDTFLTAEEMIAIGGADRLLSVADL